MGAAFGAAIFVFLVLGGDTAVKLYIAWRDLRYRGD